MPDSSNQYWVWLLPSFIHDQVDHDIDPKCFSKGFLFDEEQITKTTVKEALECAEETIKKVSDRLGGLTRMYRKRSGQDRGIALLIPG